MTNLALVHCAPEREADAWEPQLAAFRAWCRAADRSPGTIRLQMHYLGQLRVRWSDPWTVTGDDLAQWLGSADWKPETRKSARTAARAFYAWAVRSGRIQSSPADSLAPVRIPRALPRPATDGALRHALDRASDKDRLLVMLAAYAGLRAMEIAKVHRTDVREDGTLIVVGKGGVMRAIPLHPHLLSALDAEHARRVGGSHGTGFRYCHGLSAEGYLFPSQRASHISAGDVTKRLSQLLGEHWTAHTLRHRFATAAYAVDRDLRAVQELLGHAKPETTARYAAVPDGALRAAVSGVGV